MAQVVLDRLRTQEQRRRRLTGRLPAREQQRDLQLLRGQFVDRARVAPAQRLAARGQLGARLLGPRLGIEALERLDRGTQLLARQNATRARRRR